MIRLLTALILAFTALTGCGEVVVFGHVVRENPAKPEAAASNPTAEAPASKPATEATAPKPATEAAASVPPAAAAAPTQPTATESATAARPNSQTAASLPAAHVIRAVHVTLTAAAHAGEASVDAAALADASRTELKSRDLLDEQNPSADGTAEVRIESATTRATVNAVIFGRQPMAGTLTGEIAREHGKR